MICFQLVPWENKDRQKHQIIMFKPDSHYLKGSVLGFPRPPSWSHLRLQPWKRKQNKTWNKTINWAKAWFNLCLHACFYSMAKNTSLDVLAKSSERESYLFLLTFYFLFVFGFAFINYLSHICEAPNYWILFFLGTYSKTSTIFIYTILLRYNGHILTYNFKLYNLMIRDRALMKREFLFANLYTFSFFCDQLILPWYSLSFKKSSRMEPLYFNNLFG